MDLATLSFDELTSLKSRIETELVSRRHAEEQRFLADVRAKAAALGLDSQALAQLLSKTNHKSQKASTLPALYRHPETGAEWSGRGRKPKWYIACLESGVSVEALKV